MIHPVINHPVLINLLKTVKSWIDRNGHTRTVISKNSRSRKISNDSPLRKDILSNSSSNAEMI